MDAHLRSTQPSATGTSGMTRVEVASYPISLFIAGDVWQAETTCLEYCDVVGLCVTVTETTYCYTGGEEAGVIVGLIHYPRFPSTPAAIWAHGEALGAKLRDALGQQSYTIQAPDRTVWFSHGEATSA